MVLHFTTQYSPIARAEGLAPVSHQISDNKPRYHPPRGPRWPLQWRPRRPRPRRMSRCRRRGSGPHRPRGGQMRCRGSRTASWKTSRTRASWRWTWTGSRRASAGARAARSPCGVPRRMVSRPWPPAGAARAAGSGLRSLLPSSIFWVSCSCSWDAEAVVVEGKVVKFSLKRKRKRGGIPSEDRQKNGRNSLFFSFARHLIAHDTMDARTPVWLYL